jgi:hypothetical protein
MDVKDQNKITPYEFKWGDSIDSVGVLAKEMDTIDITNYTISNDAGMNVSGTSSNNWSNGSTISFANISSSDAFNAGSTEYGKNTIKTAKSTIDIDELAEMMETLKKRLLILTPDFEKHEKYPMLKELYNEYKAMESLLSGPDSNE